MEKEEKEALVLPQMGRSLEELKRISRILEIVRLITQFPRQYRRRDLAERFELSERMISKDLEIIKHGLKLALERSRDGYYFERVPDLPALQFSFTESLSLLLAVQAARQVFGISSTDLSTAVARLEASFPREFEPLLRQVFTPAPLTAQQSHRQEMLMLLHQALLGGRKVKMIYETCSRGGAISERVVHPYHLMPYMRSWHLIAYCEKREKVLMFKVPRIHKAIVLDESYQIAKEFSLEEYFGNTWGVLREQEGKPQDIVLHFDAQAGRWALEEYWHPSQKVEKQEDGSFLLRLHVTITSEFVNWLLFYGKRVKILAPPELRARVAGEHRVAMEVNDPSLNHISIKEIE